MTDRQERFYTWKDGRQLAAGRRTLVMGVLNVTPDSFSDGGKWTGIPDAAAHVQDMERDGADLIDVGAESTRPGALALTAEEEWARLSRFLPAVLAAGRTPVSVDTYHYETARRALACGAHIINDVWGLQYDGGEMASVAAEYGVPVILMHNQQGTSYDGDLIGCMKAFFSRSIDIALSHGIREENIWLDPGIGFGKTGGQNMEILRRLEELTALPYPLLLAPSRKRFIGTVLDLPAEERDEGTGAVCCFGQERGCAMVRVHNVRMIARMVKMTDALMEESWTRS